MVLFGLTSVCWWKTALTNHICWKTTNREIFRIRLSVTHLNDVIRSDVCDVIRTSALPRCPPPGLCGWPAGLHERHKAQLCHAQARLQDEMRQGSSKPLRWGKWSPANTCSHPNQRQMNGSACGCMLNNWRGYCRHREGWTVCSDAGERGVLYLHSVYRRHR